MNIEEETKKIEKFIKNKVVVKVFRNRKNEFGIEFEDGTRLFIDRVEEGLELSVTTQNTDEE